MSDSDDDKTGPEAAGQAVGAERKTAKRTPKAKVKAARENQRPEVDPDPADAKPKRKTARRDGKSTAKAQRSDPKSAVAPEAAVAKADRKSAKRQAKDAADSARGNKSQDAAGVAAAAKAERKARKRAAKDAAKAERRAKRPVAAPEDAAAKAQRKAAKREVQEAKKRARDRPEAAPVDAAADAAAKAQRKAAKREAQKAKTRARDRPESAPVDAAADAAAKAQRKAAKREAQEAKARARDRPEAAPDDAAADAAAKAQRKAAKAAAKGERKSREPQLAPGDGRSKEERKAAKREAKEAKKAAKKSPKGEKGEKRRRDEGEDGTDRAVRLAVAGVDAEQAAPLGVALQSEFRLAGVQTEAPKPEGRADIVVHTFDGIEAGEIGRHVAAMANQKARVHVFLERMEDDGNVDRAIVRLAAAMGGAIVSAPVKLKRFGLEDTLTDGHPNDKGRKLVAESVLGIAAARLKHKFARPAREAAPDLVEARALAASPADFLPQLRWSASTPPKSIWTHISQEATEALADSKIVFSSEETVALAAPIDWGMKLPDRKAAYAFNGLDFLTGPLAYWYAKANNQNSEQIAAIDAALKQRGTTPNALLARATQIILDFLEKHPPQSAPEAWQEQPLTRRVRVLLLFVLCCKAALKRKIRFNEAACTTVLRALLDLVETLRADDFYAPCSVDGIQQDSLVIGIALALRGTAYGNLLLVESLERLRRLQLDPGLSGDGVWLGDSYATHCSVLATLTGLFNDFPPADAALIEAFAAAAKKMTAFAEAMLKSNGQPPAIDDSREKSYAERLSGARKTIARAGGKQAPSGKTPLRTRITDTYVFREAQYFISHSSQKVEPESSLVVLHAAQPSLARQDPGGITLVFAHGESNLLIRAEPAEEGKEEDDQSTEFDPALRNFYRVNGEGILPPTGDGGKTSRIVKSWRGPGWAGAKGVENSYRDASVGRTAIHLKAAHALIVIDELASGGAARAAFEQFWNIAPNFAPPATAEPPLRFVSADKGGLIVVSCGGELAAIENRRAGARLRQTAHVQRGLMATLFQWTDEPAAASIAIERGEVDDWAVVASGRGFSVRLSLADSEFRCELAQAS